MKYLISSFLIVFGLQLSAQCDSTEHLLKGNLITNTSKSVKIDASDTEVLPKVGQVGELSKYFETSLFGFKSSGWLVIGLIEITKVEGKTVSVKVIEEMSEMTINGAKKNHFEKGNLVKFSWKTAPVIEPFYDFNESGDTIVWGNKLCGKKTGAWRYLLPDGSMEFSSYENGLPHGKYKIESSKGVLLEEGEYTMGKRVGEIKKYYENGQMNLIFRFDNGVKNGMTEKWYENGNKAFEVTYKNDQKNGPFKDFFENGIQSTDGNYINDEYDGLIKVFYPSGKLQYEADFTRNKKNGTYKEYYENGQLKVSSSYKMGALNGDYREYFSSGQIRIETFYTDDKLNGTYLEYAENGTLIARGDYMMDKKGGEWATYYDDGSPKSLGMYENGLGKGKWFYWDENGKKTKKKL